MALVITVNIQQINSNLTYPDADEILKNVKLEFVHVNSVVLLKGLKAHGTLNQSTLDLTWAQVGQVDLF